MATDRRKMIVEAATKSFSLFGYKATTMDQVAKLANVGKGTIYTFFKNKEELFEEIISIIGKGNDGGGGSSHPTGCTIYRKCSSCVIPFIRISLTAPTDD